jgi:hypothetical protein
MDYLFVEFWCCGAAQGPTFQQLQPETSNLESICKKLQMTCLRFFRAHCRSCHSQYGNHYCSINMECSLGMRVPISK